MGAVANTTWAAWKERSRHGFSVARGPLTTKRGTRFHGCCVLCKVEKTLSDGPPHRADSRSLLRNCKDVCRKPHNVFPHIKHSYGFHKRLTRIRIFPSFVKIRSQPRASDHAADDMRMKSALGQFSLSFIRTMKMRTSYSFITAVRRLDMLAILVLSGDHIHESIFLKQAISCPENSCCP